MTRRVISIFYIFYIRYSWTNRREEFIQQMKQLSIFSYGTSSWYDESYQEWEYLLCKIKVMLTIQPLCRGNPAYDMIEVITVMKLVTEMLVMANSCSNVHHFNQVAILVVHYCQVIANNLLGYICSIMMIIIKRQGLCPLWMHYRYDIHQIPLKILKNDGFILLCQYCTCYTYVIYWKKYTHEINPKV